MFPLRAVILAAAVAACAADPMAAPALPPLSSEADIAAAEAVALQGDAADWNAPFAPFNVIGNIHYVGASGVSSFLITTDEGHILLDGGLAQTAPMIIANIETLGLSIGDVRCLLNSHAHNDHAGGLARLQRESGAQVVASEGDRDALETGRVGYGPSADWRFPPVRVDRIIADGDSITLGGVTLTAFLTPGHTRGCTSWMMDVRGADGAQHRAFFHCSGTVAGQSLIPPSYSGIVEDYRTSFARVATVEADVFLANHNNFFDLQAKRARQRAGDSNAFVDAGELQRYNARMREAFDAEFARQQIQHP
jgi:metallo-beta-lactamase class B